LYSNLLPKTGAGLSIAGISLTLYQLTWLGIALAVAGGALVTAARLFPRIAIEPVPGDNGRAKVRLTLNGRPIRH
jgi:uncharacterized protein (DUF58 family)